MRRRLALLAAALLVGTIQHAHEEVRVEAKPEPAEVVFGRLAPGSTVGLNATNASAALVGTLLSGTTDLLWLNNTNGTGAYFARLEVYDTAGLANLVSVRLGLDNGTPTTMASVDLGVLTQTTSPAPIRLEPGSSNRVYVTQQVAVLGLPSTFRFEVIVADDTAEASAYHLRGVANLT